MTLGERIKKRREFLQLTQEQLAQKIGYKSKTTINKIEKGYNDIPFNKVKDFADALKVSQEYIMGFNEYKADDQILNTKLIELPIFKSISAGYGSLIDETFTDEIDVDFLTMPTFPNHQHCFAIKVQGDSMLPTIPNNAIVIINTQIAVDNNEIGAFLIEEDAFLKRKKLFKNNIFLFSDNQNYEPIFINENDNFTEIGKVIKIIINL